MGQKINCKHNQPNYGTCNYCIAPMQYWLDLPTTYIIYVISKSIIIIN